MSEAFAGKSSVAEIRARFDADVERFSDLEVGQVAAIDAPLCMELIAAAAVRTCPGVRSVLDVGCGAGNYTIKLLRELRGDADVVPCVDCTLVDLSEPMLERASARVGVETCGEVRAVRGDVREVGLEAGGFDVVLAAAVLHHLRGDEEWDAVFGRLFEALRPGGWLWVFDMVEQGDAGVQSLMWDRYGAYLEGVGGVAYRRKVFGYIAVEDTPRPWMWQVDRMRGAGFGAVELLHKNSVMAAWGAQRPAE